MVITETSDIIMVGWHFLSVHCGADDGASTGSFWLENPFVSSRHYAVF